MGPDKWQRVEDTQNLGHSPFLRVQTAGEELSMLLDTGADISLVNNDILSDRQMGAIKPTTHRNPKAAGGQEVQLLGVLEMTVRVEK